MVARVRSVVLSRLMPTMITAFFLVAMSPAVASQWPVDATKVFSDTCQEKESGDVAGHIVAITRQRDGWQIKYSWSEGSLTLPLQASSIRFDQSSGKLSFAVKVAGKPGTPGGTATFDGQLRNGVLTGKAKEYWETRASTAILHITQSKHPDVPKIFCH